MISRSNRFHGRGSIKRLYGKSASARTGSLSLRYAPNPQRNSYRLAVVVSKKVSKSAVVRNRIRRRLYESVRILSSNFSTPYDLVIVVYDANVATMPANTLAADIQKLLKKAGVTSAPPLEHGIVKS